MGANCPDLEWVNLFGCSYISERGVDRLVKAAGKLRYLCIRGMIGVGQQFCTKLESQHANIEIVHQFQPRPPRDRSKKF